MRIVDIRPLKAKAKATQLFFEDFLEAIVRIACTVTLPTDEQVFEAGFEDVAPAGREPTLIWGRPALRRAQPATSRFGPPVV